MDKLPYEINTIKIFASWNGFPKSVVNSIISKILNAPFIAEDFHDTDETSNKVTMYYCVTYYDDKGFSSIKPYIHKIKSQKRGSVIPFVPDALFFYALKTENLGVCIRNK